MTEEEFRAISKVAGERIREVTVKACVTLESVEISHSRSVRMDFDRNSKASEESSWRISAEVHCLNSFGHLRHQRFTEQGETVTQAIEKLAVSLEPLSGKHS